MARRLGLLAAVLCAAGAAGCINLGPFFPTNVETVTVERSGRWFETNRVAVIDIDGFIGGGALSLLTLGGTTVADVKEKLDRAAADSHVKAVVLRINSPGGEASSSDMLYQEVRRFKERHAIPVVAMILSTGTSGGYYVACAGDRILCTPTSITGSVGVIMEVVNIEGLLGKIGVRVEAVKSGTRKDSASPLRPLTPADREILDGLTKSLFAQFLKSVRQGRPTMTQEQIDLISDGRVATPEEALRLNLVDRVGYMDDAIAEARELAHIRHADVILYRAHPTYNNNIYARSQTDFLLQEGLGLLAGRRGPMFLYLWAPNP